MGTALLPVWTPGMDLPYTVPIGDGAILAISLRGAWLKPDKSGRPLLLPPAVRAVSRLRAVFENRDRLTPGFIVSLREAMGLTQAEFGRKLGVSKMTVSRWECGRMRPGAVKARAIFDLQSQARRKGVRIDGEKRLSGHLSAAGSSSA